MEKKNRIEPEALKIRSKEDAIRELEYYYNIRATYLTAAKLLAKTVDDEPLNTSKLHHLNYLATLFFKTQDKMVSLLTNGGED